MLLKPSSTRTIIQQLFAEVAFYCIFVLIISLLGQNSVSDECLVLVSVAYNKALEDAIAVLDKIAMTVDVKDRKFLLYFL